VGVTAADVGPAQLVLMASVARRHYLDGRSKSEIADEFGLSRFKVARLIEAARSSGLVRIEIRHQGVIDVDLSGRLRDRFGLQHAIVVDTPEDDAESLRRHLGRAAAELVAEVVGPDDVLGLAWAQSVRSMAWSLPRLPGIPVVQLTGAMAVPDGDDSSVDIVREAARASGGPAYVFYAPFIVPDAATARTMRRQPEVARAFEQLPSVTRAVVGIGLWAPGRSTVYDGAEPRDREALRRRGVCAEVSGVFLTAEGEPVPTGLTERMIAISGEQMRAIPEVIALPYGTVKAPAVRAALRSGLVRGLVTHAALAQVLLDPA
jgi:DNA-binding transcriptional regulator LsrR (DeoR family)